MLQYPKSIFHLKKIHELVPIQTPVFISARGLVCSVTILFLMYIFGLSAILIFRCKMKMITGIIMIVFFLFLVVVSLGFKYVFFTCSI
jgi:hypothetical protein